MNDREVDRWIRASESDRVERLSALAELELDDAGWQRLAEVSSPQIAPERESAIRAYCDRFEVRLAGAVSRGLRAVAETIADVEHRLSAGRERLLRPTLGHFGRGDRTVSVQLLGAAGDCATLESVTLGTDSQTGAMTVSVALDEVAECTTMTHAMRLDSGCAIVTYRDSNTPELLPEFTSTRRDGERIVATLAIDPQRSVRAVTLVP